MNKQQIHNREVVWKVFGRILCPLDSLFHDRHLTLRAVRGIWQCYLVICALMADYFENIHLHSIKQPDCPECNAPESLFGAGNSLSWQLRGYQLYFQSVTAAHDPGPVNGHCI